MKKTIATALLALAGVAALTATPADAAKRGLPFATELDTCLGAIYRRIDIDGANRIRHIVRDSKSDMGGYELTIDTIVFEAATSRSYSSVCMTRGALQPLRLTIASDDA